MNVHWAILPIFVGGLILAAFGWYFTRKEQREKAVRLTSNVVKEPAASPAPTKPAHALR